MGYSLKRTGRKQLHKLFQFWFFNLFLKVYFRETSEQLTYILSWLVLVDGTVSDQPKLFGSVCVINKQRVGTGQKRQLSHVHSHDSKVAAIQVKSTLEKKESVMYITDNG